VLASLLLVIWLGSSSSHSPLADASTSASAPPSAKKRLTEETMNPNLRKMEYAVRGTVVIAADKISEDLRVGGDNNNSDRSFGKIVYTNIGNPQSVGQQPLTWPRQVSALVDLPDAVGVDHPDAPKLFPSDAIARAREIKAGLGGHGSGAYSHSKGARVFRDDVVAFLRDRDGPKVPTDAERIFLSNGASTSIGQLLTALISDSTW
jgi:aspartate/methionine/tyrosine aminotransferase